MIARKKQKLLYCVAQVTMRGSTPDVSFYAYSNGSYGLHLVGNIDDENVLWYDTEEEAKKHIFNSFECVISKWRYIENN